MPIQFDTFDQHKIDRLRGHLETLSGNGKAKFYEIHVDNLTAVPKTDEPKEFDGYEDYMTPGTNQVKIKIYNSGASPRNDQYVFSMKAKDTAEALSMGLEGLNVRSYSGKEVEQLRQQKARKDRSEEEVEELENEVMELKNELIEKDEYIDKLEKAIEEAKANGNKIGGFHVGEILSVALEGIVRRNTHLIAQVPVLHGLAGIIDKDNQRTDMPAPEPASEVSFQKKTAAPETPSLTEQEKEFINLYREISRHFTEAEIGQLIRILDELSRDKTQIIPVLELLQEAHLKAA